MQAATSNLECTMQCDVQVVMCELAEHNGREAMQEVRQPIHMRMSKHYRAVMH